jgi:prepilin-type N-terminal cleavage/methylation domain-containing protein
MKTRVSHAEIPFEDSFNLSRGRRKEALTFHIAPAKCAENQRLLTSSPAFQADSKAFTLVEIMMVVAILGLTLTMSVPAFWRTLKKEGMGKVESGLLLACQEARRAAIINNKTTDLVFRPIDRTFSVPGDNEPVEIPNDIIIESLGVNFHEANKDEEARVHFNPQGTSDEFEIMLRGPDGGYRTIYLDCVTALARVENGAFNPYK